MGCLPCLQATYAVTCQVLKHLPVLQQLLERTQLVEGTPGLRRETALVLACDLLFGERFRGTGPAERAVLAHKVGKGLDVATCFEKRGLSLHGLASVWLLQLLVLLDYVVVQCICTGCSEGPTCQSFH